MSKETTVFSKHLEEESLCVLGLGCLDSHPLSQLWINGNLISRVFWQFLLKILTCIQVKVAIAERQILLWSWEWALSSIPRCSLDAAHVAGVLANILPAAQATPHPVLAKGIQVDSRRRVHRGAHHTGVASDVWDTESQQGRINYTF